MSSLRVQILESVHDAFPGMVRFSLIDANGEEHVFVDKTPVVASGPVHAGGTGLLDCAVVACSGGPPDGRTYVVQTRHGCASTSGQTRFTVTEDILVGQRDVALFVEGEATDFTAVGTNTGLNYGRFFERPAVPFEMVIPIAQLAWLAPEMAALVDEMRLDDLNDPDTSPFRETSYAQSLLQAARYPTQCAEIIETYLHRDILDRYCPFHERVEMCINSTDTVIVTPDEISIHGRAFRR